MRVAATVGASIFACACAVACGGVDRGRPETKPPFDFGVDPGSGPVACAATDGLELRTLDDFELGAAGGGWSANDDVCADCDDLAAALDGGADGAISSPSPSSSASPAPSDDDLAACRAACATSQTPSPLAKPLPAERIVGGARCGSDYALHVRGGPFARWGGMLTMQMGAPLDASAWTGVAFWARVGPRSRTPIRVEVAEEHTYGQYDYYGPGQPYCTWVSSPDDTSQRCDAFGAPAVLSGDWRLYLVPFSEMQQGGWGKHAPSFDTSKILSLAFAYGQGAWDLWIDDPALYRRTS